MENTEAIKVDKIIRRLRKTEVRSDFTNGLLDGFQEYFNEVLRQPQPAELILRFINSNGIIFPVGSTLRGTARPGSDLDLIILYEADVKPAAETIEEIIENSGKYHPTGTALPGWLAHKFKHTPELAKLYEERKQALQKEVEFSNQYRAARSMALRSFSEEDVDRRFITIEAHVFNVGDLITSIEKLKFLSTYEFEEQVKTYSGEQIDALLTIIPQLLTINADFTVETHKGNLLHHQRKITEILARLEQDNPEVFKGLYSLMARNFQAAVLYESPNHIHSVSLDHLTERYIRKDKRFPEAKIHHATQLLRGIKRQITFPPFQAFKEKYLGT